MRLDVLVPLLAALACLLVAWRARLSFRSWRARRRLRQAQRGERAAGALLEASGYRVIAEQARGAIVLTVDGAPSTHGLRADYLVTRHGRRFVAEVKTGERAPSLDHAPTRRQLLEYRVAFDVDGALLVDPDAGQVREIVFPTERSPGTRPALTTGVMIGAALATLAWHLVR